MRSRTWFHPMLPRSPHKIGKVRFQLAVSDIFRLKASPNGVLRDKCCVKLLGRWAKRCVQNSRIRLGMQRGMQRYS